MATNAPNEEEQPSAASFELEVAETAPLEPDSNTDETSDYDDGDSAIESVGALHPDGLVLPGYPGFS